MRAVSPVILVPALRVRDGASKSENKDALGSGAHDWTGGLCTELLDDAVEHIDEIEKVDGCMRRQS